MTLQGKAVYAVLGAFVLSLCLNAFLVGVYASGRYHHGDRAAFKPGGWMTFLPEPVRHAVRENLDVNRAEMQERIRAAREARRHVRDLLRSEDTTKEELNAALAEVRARTSDVQAFVQDKVAEAVLKLPPEVRKNWRPPPQRGLPGAGSGDPPHDLMDPPPLR